MKILFTAIALLFASLFASAAPKITSNYGKVTDGYNFWLSEPENASEEAKPVFIFLHGASLCGKDLNKVRRYGTLAAVEKGREIDGYVIAPQNPGGAWKPEKVMNVLEWVEKNYNVDSNRIYVLGMSLGGYGTIDFAATYPDRVAAAMAFCGGGSVKNLSGLNKLPLWIVHGTADRAVNVSQSDRVVSAMKAAADGKAPRLVYDRIPGMNHSQPARLFYLPETYDWLLSHNLTDKERPVAESFTINNTLMRGAYAGLNHRAGYHAKSVKKSKSKLASARSKKKARKGIAQAKSRKSSKRNA